MKSSSWSNLETSSQEIDVVNNIQQDSSSPIIRLGQQQPPREVMMAEFQGDRIEVKDKLSIRLCSININGVTQKKDNPKNQHIRELINTYDFDHIGLIETNCNWKYIPQEDQWSERTASWWKRNKSVVAHNTADICEEHKQPGGVINMSLETLTSLSIRSGKDQPLGRWAWTTIQGKNNVKTTIITGYRPCRNLKDANSTYNQQLRYFAALQIDKCPRQIWLDDMGSLIIAKQKEGHQIILLSDMNEDVREEALVEWARKISMKEVVSKTTTVQVATHQKGSTPIDGIYVSYTLQAKQAGYFPFGIFQSDHRGLWIDVDIHQLLGFKPKPLQTGKIRRLQCNIPHVRRAWQRHYKNFLQQHKLIERQLQLEATLSYGMITELQAKEFESILKLRQEGMAYAEKRCRKIRCGGIDFSPELRLARLVIETWKAATTIKRGGKYSSTHFRRLQNKAGLSGCLTKTLDEIKQLENEAWKNYWELRKNALKLRKNYLEQ